MPIDFPGDVVQMVQDFGEDITYRKFHGLSTNAGYFATRYFANRYFPNRYFPHGRGPDAPADRVVKMIVDRTVEAVDQGVQMSYTPLITATVSTDPVDGIPIEDVDTGGDEVLIANRPGEPPVNKKILRVINVDAQGYAELEIR